METEPKAVAGRTVASVEAMAVTLAAAEGGVFSRRAGICCALIGALTLATGWVMAFVNDAKSAAIEAAIPKLDLADNPYLLRESWWHEPFRKKGDVKIIKHQLFKRNDYWFWAGLSEPDAKVSIHIYDGAGELADAEDWQDGHVAGARIAPASSGNYYIRVELLENPGGEELEWAVIYAFR